jgi:hypothetical protein
VEQAIVSVLLSTALLLALSTADAKPRVMQAATLLVAGLPTVPAGGEAA